MREKNKKYKPPLRIRLRMWWKKFKGERVDNLQKDNLRKEEKSKVKGSVDGFLAQEDDKRRI